MKITSICLPYYTVLCTHDIFLNKVSERKISQLQPFTLKIYTDDQK